jgi:hypothetical protein
VTTPRARLENLFAAILFAAGFAWLFRRWLFTGFDGIFGDDSDGEIFLALVEHWHRVFTGAAHWPDPNFFYPERGALGFTDAVFLYGVVAAALRALGFDVFTSFMVVMASLAGLGFFGFIRLTRRHFGLAMPWAAVGAYLFAFANMDASKLIHAQSYCAMLLPVLCDLALTAWRDDRKRLRSAALAAAAGLLHGLIFFTAFQTAWFFALFLMLFAVLHPLVFGLARSFALLREAARKWQIVGAYAVGFAAGIAPFLVLYVPVLLAGRQRDLAEIFSNSPDARDILNVTPGNWVWGEALRHLAITGRPNRPWWEVELGYTPAMFALLLATTFAVAASLRRGSAPAAERDRWVVVLAIGVLVSWLVQLEYFGFRPWTIVWALVPGAKGIRYTFRSQLVANLFASLVVARGLMGLYALAQARRAALAGVVALTLLVLVEQVNLQWPPTISRRETSAWIEAPPAPPPGCRVFYLVPHVEPRDRPGWVHQSQAMLFAAARGMATINGYSSWFPDGWDLEETDKPEYAAAVRAWAAKKGLANELCGLDPTHATWTPGLP